MKDAYVNVRVDSGVKAEVETILENLGISTSTAIDMFLSQIVLKNGLPFNVKIPKNDYKKRQMELASAINLTGGNEYPKRFKKIISLYAQGEIDYDVALYAIRKEYSNG